MRGILHADGQLVRGLRLHRQSNLLQVRGRRGLLQELPTNSYGTSTQHERPDHLRQNNTRSRGSSLAEGHGNSYKQQLHHLDEQRRQRGQLTVILLKRGNELSPSITVPRLP